MSRRFLIAHAAREPEADVQEVVRYIETQIPGAEVSTAREQWNTRLGISGSADQLAVDLGGAFRMDGRPLFDVIVCMREYVGKRTAMTVRAALQARRSVLYLDGIKFVLVVSVDCVDPEDWKAGWRLVRSGETR